MHPPIEVMAKQIADMSALDLEYVTAMLIPYCKDYSGYKFQLATYSNLDRGFEVMVDSGKNQVLIMVPKKVVA